ncbi:isopenicillin N synthase family oxygenase [Kineosporia sp. A_224]|uniref:isopenicillin N synthase family dioxygenase n=1 Tax=Kineosporia sp. A_224 TaxID=1962180 RepID=UPI000B4BEB44|nr:2-oxoglutarate and iron-dependent oxygenase domain-containing protein [Kineosporia sp. A_224]
MTTGPRPAPAAADSLALVDISPLLDGSDVAAVARQIDAACRSLGFFRVTGHGIDPGLLENLDRLSREFFDQPDAAKQPYAMSHAGPAWRGWFPVRGELTSGVPDRKEGLYVGLEHPADHPRVLAGAPLHGANLFPPGGLGPAVLDWLDALRPVADAVLRAVAVGLGLPPGWFAEHLTGDPTVLFRVFHYPALADNADAAEWGVGEHTDYGILTLLAQDDLGGLQVRTPAGTWIEVPAEPGVLVCNIGDMLDRLTEGRYRSTPHRVRNVSGRGRLSFPYFFDPSWDAEVTPLPLAGSPPTDDAGRRWDGASVHAWSGRYGDYLSAKVAKVFPDLFAGVTPGPSPRRPG